MTLSSYTLAPWRKSPVIPPKGKCLYFVVNIFCYSLPINVLVLHIQQNYKIFFNVIELCFSFFINYLLQHPSLCLKIL